MHAGFRLLGGLALIASMALAAPASAQPATAAAPPTPLATAARITGRVTFEGTNTPVAGAMIVLLPSLRPMGPNGPRLPMGMPPQAISDQDGRFVFDQLTPGGYRLDVQKTGFAPLQEPGRALTELGAGQTVEVALQLQRGAVITGKVLDAAGEPMADARIMAMHRFNGPGPAGFAARLMPAGGGMQTNDLGEFRLASLAPGEYYIAAMPQGGLPFGVIAPAAAAAPTATVANVATYYPGTIDQAAAQMIRVNAGDTVTDIVFSMQAVPSFRVSGRVVDENDAPVEGAMVMLMGDPSAGAFMGPAGNARTGSDGRFTIAAVASGTYRLNASIPVMVSGAGGGFSGGAIGASSSGFFTSWSSGPMTGSVTGRMDQPTEVTVNGADVTGVRIVAQRPAQP